jgi:S-layer homology domain
MRSVVVLGTALLTLSLLTPALAQPFADTPTNHWAYDAIAELAGKGLIEGYPDGMFKGDPAMTRYEMAMVVARLLTRIESLQIPVPSTPPKPEVTRADVDVVLRLVNEFRAELAAKNVRLTAIEEELNAIKTKLDSVRITGAVRFREDLNQFNPNLAGLPGGPFPTINGNLNTSSISAGTVSRSNRPREVVRLSFDGSVSPDVHFLVGVLTNNFFIFNSSSSPASSANGPSLSTVDNAFIDWNNAFGWPLEFWLGRFGGGGQGGSTSIGRIFPVQFGPFGLLFNTQPDTWADSTGNSNFNVADGLRAALHLANLADLQLQGVAVRINGNVGAFSYPSGEDAYGVDANVKALPGLRIGAYSVWNSISQSGSVPFPAVPGAPSGLYHVYGPAGGSVNPVTAHCPAALGGVKGIACPALGSGFGAYVIWEVATGIHLDAEWAQWTDGALGGSDSGYNALVTWNLGSLLQVGHNLTVTTGYQSYGQNFYPPYGFTDADFCCWDALYPGNYQAFTATLSFSPIPRWTVYGIYIPGSFQSNGQSFLEYEVGIRYQFAPNATVVFKYRDLSIASVEQQNVYRAQLDYNF